MRILAIRGQNLASLAGKFELDLTCEPLASSGFFAITGPTGAGKSTILDALCLALYGSFPRVSVNHQETAPDPSGEPLSVKDSRAILRRGAGAGFAEVDFVGQDDVRYRARWSVSRSRQKADGRPRPEERLLTRLDDQQAVATGKSDVRQAVEERTGLTFDQFRRTVLLAQGEFDLFLLANENERAALLEKVTGTEVYAAISIRVHEETERRKKAFQDLEQKLAAMALLEENVRESHAAHQQALTETAAQKAQERKRAADHLEKLNALKTARAHLARAKADLDVAEREHQAASPNRETLQKLETLEPLRALKLARDSAQKNLEQAEAKVATTLSALESAKTKDEAAERDLLEAQKQHTAAEDAFKTYAPLWDQAAELDAKIELASKECRQAEEDERNALQAAHDAKSKLDRIATTIGELTSALKTAQCDLETRSSLALIADRQEDLARLLAKRNQDSTQLQRAKADAETARVYRNTLEKHRDELVSQRTERLSVRDDGARALQQTNAELAALNAPLLETKDALLRSFLDGTREPLSLSDRFTRASAIVERAVQDAETATKECEVAQADIATAESAVQEASTRLAELEPLHELAEGSISKEAIILRSVLIDGEPCPVCGSAEHPQSSNLDQLHAFADQLRQRREQLKALIENHQRSSAQASARLKQAQSRKDDAFVKSAEQKKEMIGTQKAYEGARAELETIWVKLLGSVPLPEILDASTGAALQSLIDAAELSKRANAEQLKQASKLRATIDQGQQEQQALAKRLTDLDDNLGKIQSELHQTDLVLTNAETRSSSLADAIVETDNDLAPFLLSAGLASADLNNDPGQVAEKLKRHAEDYLASRAATLSLEKKLQALEPEKARVQATLQAAITQQSDVATRLKNRRDAADNLKAERVKLLGGEDTNAHRTRTNDARLKAFTSLNAMQEKRRVAANDYQVAVTRKDEASLTCLTAREKLVLTAASYHTQREASGETLAVIDALLAVTSDDREGLRKQVRDLDHKLSATRATFSTRQTEVETLESSTDQTLDPETLKAVIVEREADVADLNQKIGQITEILERDALARRGASELAVQIVAARSELAVAQAVHDAIGSASGDKFRRFVQAITLDNLIALANTHLHALNPRYSLIRGAQANLSIHIVDRDMADEQRASRSLSGGERFLVSLALALALSGLEGRSSFVDTLFIDEGFGALDPETLDIAIDALETLHGRGQKVGVITHVAAMIDRVSVQVRVEKKGGGQSTVRITDASTPAWPVLDVAA